MQITLNSMPLRLLILWLLLPTICLADNDMTCTRSSFRSVTGGKTSITAHTFCYDKTKTKLSSKDCRRQQCQAFKLKKKFEFQELYQGIGNPGFALCRKLEGHPEILEFQVKKEWYKLDRCLFKESSFVNTDQLMSFYLQRRSAN